MISHELQSLLAPFKLLVSRSALNPVYRAIEIGPTEIRAAISWGILEIAVPSPGIEDSVYVDRAAFLAVIHSLPKGEDCYLCEDGTSLLWTCGRAKGRLALMSQLQMPYIDWEGISLVPVPLGLPKALELGSLSCHTTALAAVGMFGIVIDQRLGITVSSTDNTSMSTGYVEGMGLPGAAETSTLSPDGVELLFEIMHPIDGRLGFNDRAWYYADQTTYCKVTLLPPMKSDVSSVRAKYQEALTVVPIPHEAIDKFIKRANSLAEVKRNATVSLSTSDGQLVLSFKEGASTTDEYFLVEALTGLPAIPEIILSATKTARALSYVQEVVLDHVSRGVLLFRGHNPEFDYLLCGKLVSTAKD